MIATSDTAAGGIAPDAVAVGQGFRLAHLSDLHLASPLALSVGDMFSKRLVGYLSWQLRRRRIHRADVLRVLTEDLRGEGADHIVVTGDIVNISLVREFQAAATWLASLGPADRISVIPGNHDAYVRIGWEGSLAAWRPYMLSDGPPPGEGDEPNGGGARFPFLRRRGPIAVIGLSSAIPSAPGFALGRLGEAQLATAESMLRWLDPRDVFRVVLVHHPPVAPRGDGRKRLLDADAFAAMLVRAGCELVLHGHNHCTRFYELPGRDGPVPVIGVASASALPVDGHPPGQYHLYRIGRTVGGWQVDVEIRGIDIDLRVSAAARRRLTVERPRAAPPVSGLPAPVLRRT